MSKELATTILLIEPCLEDLAGNNPDRLFDANLAQKQQSIKKFHQRQLEIR